MYFRSCPVRSRTQSEGQITGSNSLWRTFRVTDRYKIQDEFGPLKKTVTFTHLGLSKLSTSRNTRRSRSRHESTEEGGDKAPGILSLSTRWKLGGQLYVPSAVPKRYPLNRGLGKPWTLRNSEINH